MASADQDLNCIGFVGDALRMHTRSLLPGLESYHSHRHRVVAVPCAWGTVTGVLWLIQGSYSAAPWWASARRLCSYRGVANLVGAAQNFRQAKAQRAYFPTECTDFPTGVPPSTCLQCSMPPVLSKAANLKQTTLSFGRTPCRRYGRTASTSERLGGVRFVRVRAAVNIVTSHVQLCTDLHTPSVQCCGHRSLTSLSDSHSLRLRLLEEPPHEPRAHTRLAYVRLLRKFFGKLRCTKKVKSFPKVASRKLGISHGRRIARVRPT